MSKNKVDELNLMIRKMWTEHAKQGRTIPECLSIVIDNLKGKIPYNGYAIADLLKVVKDCLPTNMELAPGNIRTGITILGVTGALNADTGRLPDYTGMITVVPNDTRQTLATSGTTVEQDIVVEPCPPCPEPDPVAIYGGKLVVTPTTLKETLPTKDSYVQENIVINPVTSTVDVNIAPQNIKHGVAILGVEGTLQEQMPLYEGETEITPRENEQILNTAGKTLTDNIIIRGMDMPTLKPVADVIAPLDADEACISWVKPDVGLYEQTVDMAFLGKINTAFCERVKGRMNLSLIRNNQMQIRLEASGGKMGQANALYTYFDSTFFREGQKPIIIDHADEYNKVIVVLDAVGYITAATAAHFDWIKSDEEAMAWLDILADSMHDQKYWTITDFKPSQETKDAYQRKGYSYMDMKEIIK